MPPRRVDVGPDVHHVADRLLGGEVVGRAEDALVVVLLGDAVLLLVEEPGQAHVEDLDDAGAVEQQVAGLDVAVDHAEFVAVLHADGRLGDVVGGPDRVERFLSSPYRATISWRLVPSTYSMTRKCSFSYWSMS